ncbi:MAG: hypothetical protein LBT82_01630 [Oscillospiraceae bacterium]|jgi:ComF family protein|nr:hypothetical protein [Oscillospiraceae bacterium]
MCEKFIKPINLLKKFKIYNSEEFFCLSVLKYEKNIRKAILRYKFTRRKDYFKNFAKLMAESLKKNFENLDFDFITSVPIDKYKTNQRGYNQSKELAEEMSKILNIPYKELLMKTKQTKEQHLSNAKERKENLRGVYSIIKSVILSRKSILLCDDIVTTGSTLSECVQILKEAKACRVFCVTLAATILDFHNFKK